MLTRRLGVVVTVLLLVLAGSALPAFADDGWGNADCVQEPNPGCELTAGTDAGDGGGPPARPAPGPSGTREPSAESDSSGGENSTSSACTYTPSGYQPPPGAAGSGLNVPGGQWLDGLCSASDAIRTPRYVAALTPVEVAALAREQLGLPTPKIQASPIGDQLVNLPTWLWLAGGWQRASATASVPGVSVTATAAPISVTWSMGDGGVVMCSGPGTPFAAGADPSSTSPDCGYTYRTSSASQPGEAFPVTATVNWTVTWTGAGQNGVYPDMTTSASVAFRVAESQGIATG